jgi:hypothetical protein
VGDRSIHVTPALRGGAIMKNGYEGITVGLWMLLTAWILVAVIKLLF